jgi:hypothetical protein
LKQNHKFQRGSRKRISENKNFPQGFLTNF